MYVAALTVSTFVDVLAKFLKAVYLLVFLVVPTRVHYVLPGFIKKLHSPVGSRCSFKVLLMLDAPNAEE